ncbi:proteasome 26S subunit, non-ATPase, 12 [Ramicandelaber brevisporus]|nr:proteasome 26S subunit, non-ATPase, 12 [Ramicandelaber brevisporus]
MENTLLKMEKDHSADVDRLLPEAEQLAKSGQLQTALERLHGLEKKTRTDSDLASTTRLLIAIISLCHAQSNWSALNDNIVILSKRNGQLRQAIASMVRHAMTFIDTTPNKEVKVKLIETLRSVTEDHIFVEVERARLARMLSAIHEADGKIDLAADIVQALQVETFGSMEKVEKTDFILLQMRLCLARFDYERTAIISRKINTSYFEGKDVTEEVQQLKLRYYNLMVEWAVHEGEYLQATKFYRHILDTPITAANTQATTETLQSIVSFVVLAKYDNEQSDLIHRIRASESKRLATLGLSHYAQLLKSMTTMELVRWLLVEQAFAPELRKTPIFTPDTPVGIKHWTVLRDRVIEHNLRVIAQYYTRISTQRLAELIELPATEVEGYLSNLVVSKTIYARIDRPGGLVSFVKPLDINERLDTWAADVDSLLATLDNTLHLIAKEQTLHGLKKVSA